MNKKLKALIYIISISGNMNSYSYINDSISSFIWQFMANKNYEKYKINLKLRIRIINKLVNKPQIYLDRIF